MSWVVPPIPNTPSWRGAQLKYRGNFTLPYLSLHFSALTWVPDGNFHNFLYPAISIKLFHLSFTRNSILKALKRGCTRTRIVIIRGCIQKFPDWPPEARTANGRAICHYMQLYSNSVSQPSEFCRHNPSKGIATSNTKSTHIFRYRLSPETFGYTLVLPPSTPLHTKM
jgi:hypothetical protein